MSTVTTTNYFRALLSLQTRTPLHAGILGGDRIIDRPIHREINTQLPMVSSNALKGALREQDIATKDNAGKLFGSDNDDNTNDDKPRGGKPGLLFFTDARLLLFPVRSKAGGWAWITSPRVLKKFREEARLAGVLPESPDIDAFYKTFDNAINDDQAVYAGQQLEIGSKVMLYRHAFSIDKRLLEQKLDVEKWQKAMPLPQDLPALSQRLVILSDENFREMTSLYTEVITRNKITDSTGAVSGEALFTEEYLPADSLLYALAASIPGKTQEDICGKINTGISRIQLAGNATLGKGLCRIAWHFPKTQKVT
ncbi:MAG: type III-B CRISPR module RAMP protein Cmr4 [Lewinellaceae bacterium]|nr:type III-B CRISPR module RAMP protein Cmr4 [Lewinellaceae bacterium]